MTYISLAATSLTAERGVHVAVQTGEGTVETIYGSTSIPAGPRTFTGYLARPDFSGEWPTVVVFGDQPLPSSAIKQHCRVFARHGIAALALDLTSDASENARISKAVASFVCNPTGTWSNGQLGFGVAAFGAGVADATSFAASDERIVAASVVGAAIDDVSANDLAIASIPTLFIGSRGDDAGDIEATLAHRDRLPTTTFVVYPQAGPRFWSEDADEFSVQTYEDVSERLVGFFSDHLPPRV